MQNGRQLVYLTLGFVLGVFPSSRMALAQSPPAAGGFSKGDSPANTAVLVQITGEITKPQAISAADFARLPRKTLRAKAHDGVEHQYDGVALVDVLATAGVPTERNLRGPALALQGATDEAVYCLREALAALARRGGTLYQPYGLAHLAETLALRREYAPAIAALKEGFETMDTTGERWWETELHRVNGIALCGLNKLEEGQAAFEDALRIARHQQAKLLELRAATSLARLWGEQGRRAEARELLAPV